MAGFRNPFPKGIESNSESSTKRSKTFHKLDVPKTYQRTKVTVRIPTKRDKKSSLRLSVAEKKKSVDGESCEGEVN